jgi:hypothetical protein
MWRNRPIAPYIFIYMAHIGIFAPLKAILVAQ